MCLDCRGKGDYPGLDITCRRCNGSGVWRPEPAMVQPPIETIKCHPFSPIGDSHLCAWVRGVSDDAVCGEEESAACHPATAQQPDRDPDHLRPEKGGNRASNDYWRDEP